jgi:hypothetical protein
MKIPVVLPPELQNALQANAAPVTAAATAPAAPTAAPPSVDLGQAISAAGTVISDASARYRDLRSLIQQINGMPENSPLPASLQIDSIVITYTVGGQTKTATVKRIQRVGDLFNLLTRDVDELFNTLRAQALAAREHATALEDICSRAQYTANARQSPVTP